MATNSIEGTQTVAEAMKAFGKDDSFLPVVNGLVEMNDMVADGPMKQASTITVDEIARVDKLPAPTWTKIGEGWAATLGRLQNETEGIGRLRSRAQINVETAENLPDPAGYIRLQETLHLEAMAQEMNNTLVYGESGTTPEEFDGLDVRMNSLDETSGWPNNGVFNNGEDTGSENSSIWLIQWHPTECCLIYPRYDTNAGLSREEKPQQLIRTVVDANSPYENQASAWFYITEFKWTMGFSLSDVRRVKRVCNINANPGNADSFDDEVLANALNDFETTGMVFIYANKQIRAQIQNRANEKANVNFMPNSPFGKPMWYFLESPIRSMKSITNAESVIS